MHRISTFPRNTMAATSLPLELQQQLFNLLDSETFYAARNVCRWWRYASTNSTILSKQLQKLPVRPPGDRTTATPQQLQDLFGKAARMLMLDMRVTPGEAQEDRSSAYRISASPRITATMSINRTKLVTINQKTIALFDMSGPEPRILMQRPLLDVQDATMSAPLVKVTPYPRLAMTLSSDERLLAIARECTIQIYDLSLGPDSPLISGYIHTAVGQHICGLEFEQNNYLLRLRLGEGGTVLYLGALPSESARINKAGLDHWKSENGLKHTLLDSSFLTITTPTHPGHMLAYFSGVQILRPFRNGYLFAAQKHAGGESSHYVLGHVKSSVQRNASSLGVEPRSVVVLAKLESFLSGLDYLSNDLSDTSMGSWWNMPSAHEHHPNFALSCDGRFLVLAERDKKRVRPMKQTQVFVYRLPSESSIIERLKQDEPHKSGIEASDEDSVDRVESTESDLDGMHGDEDSNYSIARIPLCLGTIQGEARYISVDNAIRDMPGAYTVRVVTDEQTKMWNLVGL